MSVNLWNSSNGKWKNDGLSAVIVDNLQKSQKTGKSFRMKIDKRL